MTLLARASIVLSVLAFATPAQAHGLGERYDLPLLLSLYLAGAAATVALSFVIVALFAAGSARRLAEHWAGLRLARWRAGRAPVASAIQMAAGGFAAAALALIVVAGIFGRQDPFKNVAPVGVWVIGWVGLAYASALLGNLWPLVNPWMAWFAVAEFTLRRLGIARRLSAERPWPRWLGAWPAAALYAVFVWTELAWPDRDRPRALASAVLAYSAITWAGMATFGPRRWLAGGEAFSVVFGLLGRFGPIVMRGAGEARELRLRPPAVGLLDDDLQSPSMTALVLMILAGVTFDGFLDTPPWQAAGLAGMAALGWLLPAAAPATGLAAIVTTVGLAVFFAIFAAAYHLVIHFMARSAGRAGAPAPLLPHCHLAGRFVLTLMPIAIAYHLAHYLSLFLVAGQFIIPIASDPLGLGWDLFGTTLYFIRIGVVDARFVWNFSVAAIVVGHVAAVWLAHVVALRYFGDRRIALSSQYPMLALMVAYTFVSLWILAQPITRGPG